MSRTPLSRHDILGKVELFRTVPDSFPAWQAAQAEKMLQAAGEVDMTGVIAVWPDGTWAILGHNPDWAQPRPYQLLRAYQTAFTAGINISNTIDDQSPPPKQGLIINANE